MSVAKLLLSIECDICEFVYMAVVSESYVYYTYYVVLMYEIHVHVSMLLFVLVYSMYVIICVWMVA